jgi:P-type E1-E2 ATPase
LLKKKLRMLTEEEALLLELMKMVQRQCFEENRMSMEEYEQAMSQYEMKLSETVEDKIRTDIASILAKIKETGSEIVLVTGDTVERAEKIGHELGFSKIVASCLPEHKMDLVQQYELEGKKVVMVGDGVNDAPAIGRATVGIALGYHGSTTSTDTADAIITSDDTAKVLELTEISQKTMRIAFESIFIGMGLSVIAMIFALLGYIRPISGAILQEVIDVLVILNALRALRD